jgi:hypothetical protein
MNAFQRITLTPAVLRAQECFNGRAALVTAAGEPIPPAPLGDEEIRFVQARDSFYIATVNEDGWPYIQHRGGRLASWGARSPDVGSPTSAVTGSRRPNLSANEKVALFLRTTPTGSGSGSRARRGPRSERIRSCRPLALPGYPGVVERLFVIQVARMTGTARSTSGLAQEPDRFPLPSAADENERLSPTEGRPWLQRETDPPP